MSGPVRETGASIREWLVTVGLEGSSLGELVDGFARRVTEAGLPVSRVYLAIPSIDPALRAENVTWRPGRDLVREGVEHGSWPRAFETSPFKWMLDNGVPRRRWRLDDPGVGREFELLAEMRDEGASEYAAHIVSFGGGATTALKGVALSVCTERPDGFLPADLALLNDLVPTVALVAYRIALSGVAAAVLGAYVGHDAGRRILNGEIVRGEGRRLGAALLFADLAGFTTLADGSGADLVGRLGEHLAAIVEPIEQAGGEVLKFMGDGVLAAIGVDEAGGSHSACRALLAGARGAIGRNALVNARYRDNTPLGLDVALHRGDVFYGNVGGGSRLDFTVIGPAVNEASRLEHLCGHLGEPLLMSAAFAESCGSPVRSLGSHRLRGLAEPREVFAPTNG